MQNTHIVLLEGVHPVASEYLKEQGFTVETFSESPKPQELSKILARAQVVGIRSKTELTAELIAQNSHLTAIGAFCIGTNQIDLAQARSSGIPVFNAPHSNTRSVAEMVVAELVVLSRQLGDRNTAAHRGDWLKTAAGSREIRGKTLGIVGYGHIGSQVSILAEGLGLRVVFFDTIKKLPLGNARPCSSLPELLKVSDFVTLHVPETEQTKNMMAREEFSAMKKGSYLINASRGSVVVIEDLVTALKAGGLAGCAVDVFPEEPASNKEKFHSPLQGLANVFLTPHVGGSTEEAQYAIGLEVAESLRRYLVVGSTLGSVNFPAVDLPIGTGARRILNVHRNEPGVLGEINSVVSASGANIRAQYLSTDPQIGYLVMDVEGADAVPLTEKISKLPRSIKTRYL